MKLGCTAWTIAGGYNVPYDDAVDMIGRLGFQGVELIAGTFEHIDEYYTEARCNALRQSAKGYGMEISQFVIYKALIDGMTMGGEEREKAYRTFEKACQIAKWLGTEIINTVSHWIPGLSAPVPYPPSYVYISVPTLEKFEPVMSMSVPEFDWEQLWNHYMESLRHCCDIAASYGLKFSLEGHPHVIVSHTDTFLRCHNDVGKQNFGMNFDTAMQADQREHIPISLQKLKGKLLHLHVRDSDSLVTYRLPIGKGVLDWHEIIRTLNRIGYEGFLSLELNRYADPVRWVGESKRYLERVIEETR